MPVGRAPLSAGHTCTASPYKHTAYKEVTVSCCCIPLLKASLRQCCCWQVPKLAFSWQVGIVGATKCFLGAPAAYSLPDTALDRRSTIQCRCDQRSTTCGVSLSPHEGVGFRTQCQTRTGLQLFTQRHWLITTQGSLPSQR